MALPRKPPCPSCKSQSWQKHCPSPTCTWQNCKCGATFDPVNRTCTTGIQPKPKKV